MKVIIVSGSVGTGKTTIARKLAKKLNFCYIDVNGVISSYKLSESYDKIRKCKIIDVKKLNKVLIKVINKYKSIEKLSLNKNQYNKFLKNKKLRYNVLGQNFGDCKDNYLKNIFKKIINKKNNGIIIDSHLSHYIPKRYVDLCIITKCELKRLKKRLEKRSYNKNKVRENIECEIFDVCYNEALEKKHNIIVINTTKHINTDNLSKRIKWQLTHKQKN